jgi:hypothetical protein
MQRRKELQFQSKVRIETSDANLPGAEQAKKKDAEEEVP